MHNGPNKFFLLATVVLACTVPLASAKTMLQLPNHSSWLIDHSSGPAVSEPCQGNAQVQVWLPKDQASPALATLAKWAEHPLAKYVGCLSYRWYASADELRCQAQGQRQHQRCDLALLPGEVTQRQLVFLNLPATQIASTDSWQMVLPVHASVDVLAHEMGHWLGFADEYSMSLGLAQNFCRGRYEHPSLNVVVTDKHNYSATELKQLWQRLPWRTAVDHWQLLGRQDASGAWQLGSTASTDIGLFASATCAAVPGVYSWKPVAEMTAMEYHDVNVWPSIYFDLLENFTGPQK